jgi:hypothetical protein
MIASFITAPVQPTNSAAALESLRDSRIIRSLV